ncbi:NDP-hexose 2,3-dehydratase family protein, partial [Candidatus Pelagibacter sp.]|nr:NDP-hexose 2,3-dehydratase family protein [Candidatus Pelagibacter sp.]
VCQEPGFQSPKFTSTISEKNYLPKDFKKYRYSSHFMNNKKLLDITNSDEGGRFFKNQTRNVVCQIQNYKKINLNKRFIWVSHNQIVDLINKNLVTIEARILFACYNIDKIK